MSERELWTTSEVAEEMGWSHTTVGRALSRLGVKAVARQPGKGGENLWDAEEVRAAVATRPGRWP